MNKVPSKEEIEKQLMDSLDKIPFEMKKVKFLLWVFKKINSLKNIFK